MRSLSEFIHLFFRKQHKTLYCHIPHLTGFIKAKHIFLHNIFKFLLTCVKQKQETNVLVGFIAFLVIITVMTEHKRIKQFQFF